MTSKAAKKALAPIYFPNTPLFVKPKGNFLTSKGVVTFVTRPNQTKFELKQYLARVYGLGIIKVNTQIVHGKMKRDMKGKWYRTRTTKKVIATVDNSSYLDRLHSIAAASNNDKTEN